MDEHSQPDAPDEICHEKPGLKSCYERVKRWRKRNKAKASALHAAWRSKNRTKVNAYSKLWMREKRRRMLDL